MKLGTLKNKTRDGLLIVVDRELTRCVTVTEIAPTMQAALDDWHRVSPKLREVYQRLNAGDISGSMKFDATQFHAPLPRAYQWADASTYLPHVELVRKSRGVDMPQDFYTNPLMYQGGSDAFLGPYDPIPVKNVDWGVDFEAEVTVITRDVPAGIGVEEAGQYVALVTITNDVSLRNLAKDELAKGFGFFQCKPPSSFAPVVVSPDELGDAWRDSRLHLSMVVHYNGQWFGHPNAGVDMQFNFAELIAHAAKTRPLGAGTIIGAGTVSNRDYQTVGSSCIVERRTIEQLEHGSPKTPYMQYGDTVTIEMKDTSGRSIFGKIEQSVERC